MMRQYGITIGGAAVGVWLASWAAAPALGQAQGFKSPGLESLGLNVDRDLRNPAAEGVVPAGLFIKADKDKPVTFAPVLAVGSERPTHGGWYPAGPKAGDIPADPAKVKVELWTFAFSEGAAKGRAAEPAPLPLRSGSPEFDPGLKPFGLWVINQQHKDGGVFTQPAAVAKVNSRLAGHPQRARIYPNRNPKSRRLIADSYLIAWSYSGGENFQEVVTRIDNVRLLSSDPPLKGVLAASATVVKAAGGFQFTEGPAWDFRNRRLYFSDLPPKQIVVYHDAQAGVVKTYQGQTNGLMFDKDGLLVGCENAGRRLSRDVLSDHPREIVSRYNGKRLNSPNDLWIDAAGGIYFTDPRYGPTQDLEQDKEAVYYLTADGAITRVVDDLVKPNGIAIAPAGNYLYVIDNGADSLWRYRIESSGHLGKGERIAYVEGPDGMSVDAEGRLYATSRRGVSVLQPDGRWLGLIETPEQPANCTFGGADGSTLFMTARTSLYRVETTTRGWHVHLDGAPAKK